MSENMSPSQERAAAHDVQAESERLGLGRRVLLVLKVVEVRLRFIAILLAVGLFIGYWDTVKNYWDRWTRPQAVAVRQLAADQEFFCPMHPNVVRNSFQPNGDVPQCPICGMPLSVRKKGQPEPLPPGITGRVQFSPERIQLAGVRTATIGYRPMALQTITVGYVAFDESRLARVVSRVDGYVERLYVDQTYVVVEKGRPLAEIYSPELYSAAEELVRATRTQGQADLAAGARKKLALLGVAGEEIEAIVQAGQASARLVLRSPQSGYVMNKAIVAGARVEQGMTLLEVADLSAVWIEADVFEKDVGLLQVGQAAEATVEAFPNRTFRGRLALVYPQLDPATRTNRVRFELDNPTHELRPGMFATVRIDTPLESIEPYRTLAVSHARVVQVSATGNGPAAPAELLSVPERAVVDTGTRKVVYVERGPGLFEGVEVRLGPRIGEYYPVLEGLAPGDRVAAAGAFLIDAETRLNPAAAASYFGATGAPRSGREGPEPTARQEPPAQPAGELTAEELRNVAQLPEPDRTLAQRQKLCPITGKPLGSMGVPYKLVLRNLPVFLCCKGCVGKAKSEPEETLRKIHQSTDSRAEQP